MSNNNIFKRIPLVIALGLGLVACNDDSSNSASPAVQTQYTSVSLQVFDSSTGDSLSSVNATVIGTNISGTTTAEGKVFLNKMPTGTSTIKLSKDGYVDQIITVPLSDKQQLSGVNVQLVPYQNAGQLSPDVGGMVTLADSTAQVKLSGNSLVRVDGQAIQGKVSVNFGIINTAQDIKTLPGDYTTISNDVRQQLESYGAISIDLRDESGALLKLADNASIDIQIPVMTKGTAPQTAPLYYFDQTLGYWVLDPEHALTLHTDSDGHAYYSGTTTTLAPLSAGSPYTTVAVKGCITDELGNRINNSSIFLEGKDYSGYSVAYSDANGDFSIPAKISSTVIVGAQVNNSKSNSVEYNVGTAESSLASCLIVPNADQNISIRLSWGQNPEDLDSYLITPDGTWIYYGETGSLTKAPYANLDVDDTDSYGPELMSISKLMVGDYYYYVNNYSESSNPGIYGSPTKVELTTPNGTQIFSPANATGETNIWQAFKLTVADNCTITVTPVKQFVNDVAKVSSSTAKYCSK